ncbi:hypothetical protein HPB52_007284 [Rhipicephalus sanguineus]|uniref:Uncharacterized protein n=1 Tax=Rhipicephalus sanguineus TaxID=34632 RepID=A0A9D4PKJ2_RHISA|nr:hypothetical protein HPB52_007284 [Rhipicephalus sanguineus]
MRPPTDRLELSPPEPVAQPRPQLKDGHGTDVQKATASMLKKIGLEDEKDKMPSEVSCGTLRMLSLAIAIASQPKVV